MNTDEQKKGGILRRITKEIKLCDKGRLYFVELEEIQDIGTSGFRNDVER
jgi:hypothetical protein